MTLFKLGEAYKAQNDLDRALGYFQEALSIERKAAEGGDVGTIAKMLNEIGNIHLAQGNVIPMMEALNEASRIYRNAGLSPSSLTVDGQLYNFDIPCPNAAPAA